MFRSRKFDKLFLALVQSFRALNYSVWVLQNTPLSTTLLFFFLFLHFLLLFFHFLFFFFVSFSLSACQTIKNNSLYLGGNALDSMFGIAVDVILNDQWSIGTKVVWKVEQLVISSSIFKTFSADHTKIGELIGAIIYSLLFFFSLIWSFRSVSVELNLYSCECMYLGVCLTIIWRVVSVCTQVGVWV